MVICNQTYIISEVCLCILDYLHSYKDVSLCPIFPTAAAYRHLMKLTAFLRLQCDVFHWYDWKSPLLWKVQIP